MCLRSMAPPPSSTCSGISQGAHLHDVGRQAEPAQRVGRLQAEQPAADDHAGRWPAAEASLIASRSSIVR